MVMGAGQSGAIEYATPVHGGNRSESRQDALNKGYAHCHAKVHSDNNVQYSHAHRHC